MNRFVAALLLFMAYIAYLMWSSGRNQGADPGAELAAQRLAVPLAAALTPFEKELGVIRSAGAAVRMGSLRFTPREVAEGTTKGFLHVHVVMDHPRGRGLDACVSGSGDNGFEQYASAANAFVTRALPVFVAAVRDKGFRGGHPFWGHEPWAVPGRRGYFGHTAVIGSPSSPAIERLPLFKDVVGVPADGIHVVKAVLYQKEGQWLRTIELDGDTELSPEAPFEMPIELEALVLIRFAAVVGPSPAATKLDSSALFDALQSNSPKWLNKDFECPAELLPNKFEEGWIFFGACGSGAAHHCLKRCEAGDGSYCYNVALELERAARRQLAAAMFARACALGVASACTNLTAGRVQALNGGRIDACAAKTFETVCERGEDPWACAMFAGALTEGQGVPADAKRAVEFAKRACAHDEDDPACEAATSFAMTSTSLGQ